MTTIKEKLDAIRENKEVVARHEALATQLEELGFYEEAEKVLSAITDASLALTEALTKEA